MTPLELARAEADRAMAAAPFGVARAEAIARQLALTVELCRSRGESTRGLAEWPTLMALASAATGEARAELLTLTLAGAGGHQQLTPDQLAKLTPLLEPATARAWIHATLARPELDADDANQLLRLLPVDDLEQLLPPRIERAVAIADSHERWTTLFSLVDRLPEPWPRRAGEASRARHGVELLRIAEGYDLAGGYDAEAAAARAESERQHFGAPFTAWRLGDEARALPRGERGPLLDRAIDEFDAIALTPTSPGNDEGPFWAIAAMLDERQVRRALDVVARMGAADWKGDLDAARAALSTELARRGHADEAETHIARIAAPFFRGRAWGGIIGARLLDDATADFATLWARALRDPAGDDRELRYRLIEEAIYTVAEHELAAAHVEALIAAAQTSDAVYGHMPLLPAIAIEHLVAKLPVSRWIAIVMAEPDELGRVELLRTLALALNDARLDPTPVLTLLLPLLERAPPHEPLETFGDLGALRRFIAPDAALARWTDFVHAIAGPWVAVSVVLEELPAILEWLAGPEALLAVGRALAPLVRAR